MTFIARRLVQGTQLPAAAAASPGLYACPANEKVMVRKATFTNDDSSTRLLTIHLVASGGTAAASNLVTKGISIPPGSTYEAFEIEGHILEAGDFITAFSDVANKITCHMSGAKL